MAEKKVGKAEKGCAWVVILALAAALWILVIALAKNVL